MDWIEGLEIEWCVADEWWAMMILINIQSLRK